MKALLKRLENSENSCLATVTDFAEFVKLKIDKKRSEEDIVSECNMIDIDKDGFIGQEDLKTCLENVQSFSFFDNGKKSLKTP
jgi:Ca2+-binding EF-hand superfamily protein